MVSMQTLMSMKAGARCASVPRLAELRTGRAYLDDGEAKGFLEGDVGEDAAGGIGQAVDVGDVHLAVLLGVGNTAVQVVAVHQLQDLGQDLVAACSHAVDVLAVALQS